MENVLSCCSWPHRNEAFCIKVTNQGVFGEKKQEVQQGTSGKVRKSHQAAQRQMGSA